MLLRNLGNVPYVTRKPNQQVVAKAEGAIIPAAGWTILTERRDQSGNCLATSDSTRADVISIGQASPVLGSMSGLPNVPPLTLRAPERARSVSGGTKAIARA